MIALNYPPSAEGRCIMLYVGVALIFAPTDHSSSKNGGKYFGEKRDFEI